MGWLSPYANEAGREVALADASTRLIVDSLVP